MAVWFSSSRVSLDSLMNQPPFFWNHRSEHSCHEVISKWNVDCSQNQWNVIKSWSYAHTYFLIVIQIAKRRHLSLLVFCCGAKSVPKDPCLPCLCFAAASMYEVFTMRNACVMIIQMRWAKCSSLLPPSSSPDWTSAIWLVKTEFRLGT